MDAASARSVFKAPATHGSLSDGVLAAVQVNAEQLGMSVGDLLSREEFVHGTTVATNAMLTAPARRAHR